MPGLTLLRRSFARIWMTSTVLLSVVFGVPTPASADAGGGCNVLYDPSCTVSVGDGGTNGQSQASGSSSASGPAPCSHFPDAVFGDKPPKVSQACADDLQYRYCQAEVADAADGLGKAPAQWTAGETTAINGLLQGQGCPPVVTPAQLAEQAFRSIRFPQPSGDRSPSQTQRYRGYPFTYVGLWTWWWTSAASWKSPSL